MIFRVSRASERLVGRLDTGDELVETLSNVCDDHGVTAAEIRAVGHFDAIELLHFNSAEQRYETLVDGEGNFELVSLSGNVSKLGDEVALRLDAVFNVVGPVGPQMVGGQLRRARAQSAEFVIETFSDLEMERKLDPESGRLVLEGIERKPGAADAASSASGATTSPAPSAPGDSSADSSSGESGSSMSWDEAIAEADEKEKKKKKRRNGATTSRVSSKSADQEEHDPFAGYDFDEPMMARGDLLDHPKLGTCRILSVEDDQYVKIRLPRGRVRKLMLSVLEIEYRGEEDGKKVFEAEVR